jgi:hypothetical protein
VDAGSKEPAFFVDRSPFGMVSYATNMILFYIKAKLSIYIRGISGASQEGVSRLVNAQNPTSAKLIFEEYCRRHFSHLEFERIEFEYLEIAYEIN